MNVYTVLAQYLYAYVQKTVDGSQTHLNEAVALVLEHHQAILEVLDLQLERVALAAHLCVLEQRILQLLHARVRE